MIVQIPNILTTEEVTHCRQMLEKSQWVDGAINAGEQAKKVKFKIAKSRSSKEVLD